MRAPDARSTKTKANKAGQIIIIIIIITIIGSTALHKAGHTIPKLYSARVIEGSENIILTLKFLLKDNFGSLNAIQSIYEHTNFITSAIKHHTAAASNKPEGTLAISRS
jgi:hypothetical protein